MSNVLYVQNLEKQLAAALAAIKSKDAALQSAISAHGYESGDLHDALAIKPDDSALQAWLGEPVGWYNGKDDEYGYDTMTLFEDVAVGSNLYATKGMK